MGQGSQLDSRENTEGPFKCLHCRKAYIGPARVGTLGQLGLAAAYLLLYQQQDFRISMVVHCMAHNRKIFVCMAAIMADSRPCVAVRYERPARCSVFLFSRRRLKLSAERTERLVCFLSLERGRAVLHLHHSCLPFILFGCRRKQDIELQENSEVHRWNTYIHRRRRFVFLSFQIITDHRSPG